MIDITVLRILKTRLGFNRVKQTIVPSVLEKQTQILLTDIENYYQQFDHEQIDFVQFRDLFKLRHRSLSEEQRKFYDTIINNIDTPIDEPSTDAVINLLTELNYAQQVAELLERYNADEDLSILNEIADLTKATKKSLESTTKPQWIQLNLEDLVSVAVEPGLTFRLPEIRQALRPLIPGDAMIVAGRPGKGKTTFLTDTAAYMATQIDDRPIVWCNNESAGTRIIKRAMQSALNATMSELASKSEAKTLTKDYADAISGTDKIRVVDIHGYWNWQVAKIVEQNKPKLLILDMVDNIKFAGISKLAREDQRLEAMYKWARELGVEHNCVVICTSQISMEGDGLPFPSEGMLKDSKTGKQGATDTILMIGSSNDPALEQVRWLSTPKSKFDLEGAPPLRLEVILDKDRGRFIT